MIRSARTPEAVSNRNKTDQYLHHHFHGHFNNRLDEIDNGVTTRQEHADENELKIDMEGALRKRSINALGTSMD